MSRKANEALIEAAERSDLEGVQAAVAQGASVNHTDDIEGYTVLHHAAINGKTSLASFCFLMISSVSVALRSSSCSFFCFVLFCFFNGLFCCVK